MKQIITLILGVVIIMTSCKSKPKTIPQDLGFSEIPTAISCSDHDSIIIGQGTEIFHLKSSNIELNDWVNDCEAEKRKLQDTLTLSKFKLERVRYYLNICLRNPSQDKFLKGWVKRALE